MGVTRRPRSDRVAGDYTRRMRRDPLDDVAQIYERIDLEVFARLDQRTQDRGAVRRRFAARKEPILAAEHDGPERLLRAVVVDLEAPVLGVARQGGPVAQRVTHCGAQRALRQRRRTLLL